MCYKTINPWRRSARPAGLHPAAALSPPFSSPTHTPPPPHHHRGTHAIAYLLNPLTALSPNGAPFPQCGVKHDERLFLEFESPCTPDTLRRVRGFGLPVKGKGGPAGAGKAKKKK
jgi:hypothetical protein